MIGYVPAYLRLPEGEIESRASAAVAALKECHVCPRACAVDRHAGRKGACGIGRFAMVSSVGPHVGEEAPLVGTHGSGTIFFSGCNLDCVYCQNHDISRLREGTVTSPEMLAAAMVYVQELGCHNVNLVSPTHVVPQILEALVIAVRRGLGIPIVYNSGGYDSIETLRRLDGVVDIYMPDMKYADEAAALRFSGGPGYPGVNQMAVLEMHRQVGDLALDSRGIATRGLLIRHLVLPEGLAGTPEIINFVARRLGSETYINVMAQYHPSDRADRFEPLARRITSSEYQEAVRIASAAGLRRGFPDV